MGQNSKIEWTDATWNPFRGCTRVSPGCGGPGKHGGCYAENIAARFSGAGQPFEGFAKRVGGEARWSGKIALMEDHLPRPLRWKKPARIFVNSMSDLFHEDAPDEWIDKVFAVMALAPHHTYQLLTKRSGRMRAYMTDERTYQRILSAAETFRSARRELCRIPISNPRDAAFWPQLWLGVSAEDQARYDERKDDLRQTPASIRFMSLEPLLGPIVGDWFGDWAIVGAESGPRARSMQLDWARSLRDQCFTAGAAFFMKQLPGPNGRAIKDLALFPEYLRVRQFPPPF